MYFITQNIRYSRRYEEDKIDDLLKGKLEGKIDDFALKQAELELKLKELLIKKKRIKLEEIIHRTKVRAYKKSEMKFCNSCESLIDGNALICPICGIQEIKRSKNRLAKKEVVIQLFITDLPGVESPFVKGLNSIACPYKVFKDSKMNSLLEMFDSANLEEKNPKLSGWDKIILPQKKCTAGIAENVLNLILTELFSETMGEEVIL